MESSVSMIDTADGVVSMEVPGWDADVNGYILGMEATVTTRRSQDMRPPQLIFHFCRRTISPSTHAVEIANFEIQQPYQNIISRATWNEETTWMLCHVAGRRVRAADLALLVIALRRYTRTVLHLYPIMELSTMEFLVVIEIPPEVPSTSVVGRLHYSVPLEMHQFLFGGEGENDIIGGPTPTPRAAAAERLQTKIAEEPGVCSICLDDFNVPIEILEMPCRHIFHDACLREWLSRSNTCPLCRFTLLPEAE